MGQRVEILVTGTDTATVERLDACIDRSHSTVFPRESACIRIAYGEEAVSKLAEGFEARKSMIFPEGRMTRPAVETVEGEFDFGHFAHAFHEFMESEGLLGEGDTSPLPGSPVPPRVLSFSRCRFLESC